MFGIFGLFRLSVVRLSSNFLASEFLALVFLKFIKLSIKINNDINCTAKKSGRQPDEASSGIGGISDDGP